MPTPQPNTEDRSEWMGRCIPKVLEDGTAETQDQAVAICSSMWDEGKNMSKTTKSIPIRKADEENKVVKGVVYAAHYVDSDGETMTPEDVRKAAWEFLANSREKNIDVNHNWKQSGCYVVESYVTEAEDEYFPSDAWVLGVKCTDEVWEEFKAGNLNGFSFGGSIAEKYPQRVMIEVAKEIIGETYENANKDVVPPHTHNFTVYFDNSGNIVKGITDVVQNHWHSIKYGTATEVVAAHAHRVSLEED